MQVNHDDVLAVVLSDVASQLTFSVSEIGAATVKGGFGYKNQAKDFLIPHAISTLLTRGPNTTRRKCTAFKLSKLADSTKDSLLKGQCDLFDC